MSKMMILGVKGEEGLWLVDFASGTVTAMDGKREDYIAAAANDASGADVAVAVETQEAAFSGLYYKTPQLDIAVAVEAQETPFSAHYYKTPQLDVAIAVEAEETAFSAHYYKTPAVGLRAQ